MAADEDLSGWPTGVGEGNSRPGSAAAEPAASSSASGSSSAATAAAMATGAASASAAAALAAATTTAAAAAAGATAPTVPVGGSTSSSSLSLASAVALAAADKSVTFPSVSDSPLKSAVGGGAAAKSTAGAKGAGSTSGGAGASPRKVKAISDMNLTQLKFRELEIQQQHVHELHRELSQRKADMAKQTQRLDELSAQLGEAEDKLRAVLAQSQEAEQRDSTLRKQEDEIARARACVAERHQYMRTLHHMVDRLVRSRLACEERVEALRASNGEARKELSASLQRLRKAEAGEASAREALARARARAAEQRTKWEGRLAERREAMTETSEVLAFREAQLAAKSAIIAQVKGDLDTEGEQRLTRKVVATKLRTIAADGANVRRTNSHGDLELAFRRIIDATGITSMGQVLDKFLNQGENVKSLNMMIDEATGKIAQLQEARALQRRGAEALRFEGALGVASAHRKAIDEREVEIDAVAKTNKRLAERLALLQSVVRGIRAAILHINRSLDAHQIPDVPGNPVSGELLALLGLAASDDGGAGGEPQGAGVAGYSDEPGEADDGAGNGGGGAGGAGGARAQGQQGGGRGELDWFVQALAACEQRTLKLVEMLPSRDVRIDDVDAKTLDRFAFIKTALDMGREDPRSLASKAAVKKLLKGQQAQQQQQQQQPRRPIGHLPRSAVKRLRLVEQLSRHEALAAVADQTVADAERVFKHTREVPTSLPEQLLSTDQKLHAARDEAREARRVAQLLKDQLEQLDAGELDLPSDEEVGAAEAEEEELDEFERSVTMIGDKEGRDIIKAENKRLLLFAEKKRAGRKPSPTAPAPPPDDDIIAAVKSETRRTSVIRPQRQTRLSFIKQAQAPHAPAPLLRPPLLKQGDTGRKITARSLFASPS